MPVLPVVPNVDDIVGLDPVQEAALCAHDAVTFTTHPVVRKGQLASVLHRTTLVLRPLVNLVLIALVVVSFFEMPGWCTRNRECRASYRDARLTGKYESGTPFFRIHHHGNESATAPPIVYPLFGLPIIPDWTMMLVELVTHIFLGAYLACEIGAQGWRAFLRGARLNTVFAAVLTLSVLDAIVRACDPWPAGYLAPYLRMSMLCLRSHNILFQLRLVRNTLLPLSGIIIVLASFLLFYSWVGILVYTSRTARSQGRLYFTNWGETAWQLFVCLTTANYPDVMMPAYTDSRASFAYFFVFLCLGMFFLLNVVIAVVCNEYNAAVKREVQERAAFRAERLQTAFQYLNPSGDHLPRARVEQLFKELNHLHTWHIAHIDADRARIIFDALDTTGDNTLSKEEFSHLADLLTVRFYQVRKNELTCICTSLTASPCASVRCARTNSRSSASALKASSDRTAS